MKICTIIGARPQFIKASAVSAGIANSKLLSEIVIHTGQHFDINMSDVFFADLGMRVPDYQLNIHGGRHGEMTGRMLVQIEQALVNENPDAVLVYGDTNSTLAGALAASKLQIPVAHVEAGLRSFNLAMPEEINRILTDRISRWLFTPTEEAFSHLRNEGVHSDSIIPVGDVMFDVALYHGARMSSQGGAIERFGLNPGKYVLATIHRAENTDNPTYLTNIVEALKIVGKNLQVVWPLHPRTRGILSKLGKLTELAQVIQLVEPVGYLDMVQLEKYSCLIATDSGGVQKEAFFFQIPCVTLRHETEWTELITHGWNRLVPPLSVGGMVSVILDNIGNMGETVWPYGKGDAAKRIVNYLEKAITS